MEFHDVLHGVIRIENAKYQKLISELLSCTEIQRLRNMRQMNFDVPIIQELGRSRRLPHSIGVMHIAITLAENSGLCEDTTKELIAASLLHDAAIPPYGHLVETELNQRVEQGFKHDQVIKEIISGNNSFDKNRFSEILKGRIPEVRDILDRHSVSANAVYELIAPSEGKYSSIAADIDIDNLDNIHRMAIMLGWHDARENIKAIVENSTISSNGKLIIEEKYEAQLQRWLDYRQKIYTLIISHPECIPQNSLQSDLVKQSVADEIISKENWYITEPEFEEKLRNSESTRELAWQLITGCKYHLIDYIWAKGIKTETKLSNRIISEKLKGLSDELRNDSKDLILGDEYTLFVWYENRLISRKINWHTSSKKSKFIGEDSHSCLIALVKKTEGGGITKGNIKKWRELMWSELSKLTIDGNFTIDYPDDYTGDYFNKDRDSGNLF